MLNPLELDGVFVTRLPVSLSRRVPGVELMEVDSLEGRTFLDRGVNDRAGGRK